MRALTVMGGSSAVPIQHRSCMPASLGLSLMKRGQRHHASPPSSLYGSRSGLGAPAPVSDSPLVAMNTMASGDVGRFTQIIRPRIPSGVEALPQAALPAAVPLARADLALAFLRSPPSTGPS